MLHSSNLPPPARKTLHMHAVAMKQFPPNTIVVLCAQDQFDIVIGGMEVLHTHLVATRLHVGYKKPDVLFRGKLKLVLKEMA